MSAQTSTWDISIDQGATFKKELTFVDALNQPVDVTTWMFSGQIRPYYDSPDVYATFVFTAGAAPNKVWMILTDSATRSIPVPPSGREPKRKKAVYIYDVEAVTGAGTDRIFEGAATVSAEVTKL